MSFQKYLKYPKFVLVCAQARGPQEGRAGKALGGRFPTAVASAPGEASVRLDLLEWPGNSPELGEPCKGIPLVVDIRTQVLANGADLLLLLILRQYS